MYKLLYVLFPALLMISCDHEIENPNNLKLLGLDDIKREYQIADSLNYLPDRSNIDTTTLILGMDERNGKVVIRSCQTRGFGCILVTNYYTILYQDCDSICCKKNGNWLVDYVGFAGFRSPVGCEPDTTGNH
ncbi:hypothetical protein D1614_07010 [Maribellus luteus]|uniref:Lipoprotein n=1 Tax=Maribellus luteus TaxID=2305463 RepID=A0A399SYR4_9BACT|nr:hypothetical protein [Maribellus luteus]RIJ49290.1 hypothetical protein D1614_07010 [Maribellus luteus]